MPPLNPMPLLAPLLLAACAAANTPAACRLDKRAELPLDLTRGQPIVEATIDGAPARLLLDTGASGIMLTASAFDRLGLHYDLQGYASTVSIGANAPARLAAPAVIRLGAAKLETLPIVVLPSATGVGGAGQADGLLGMDALKAHDIDIDLPNRRIALYGSRNCPLGPPPFAEPSRTIAVPPDTHHLFRVPMQIDGRTLSFVLDTGANRTYANAARLDLSEAERDRGPAFPIATAGPASVTARLRRVQSFAIAGDTPRPRTLLVGQLETGWDGLLGTDELARRRVWLSPAGLALTLASPPSARPTP